MCAYVEGHFFAYSLAFCHLCKIGYQIFMKLFACSQVLAIDVVGSIHLLYLLTVQVKNSIHLVYLLLGQVRVPSMQCICCWCRQEFHPFSIFVVGAGKSTMH